MTGLGYTVPAAAAVLAVVALELRWLRTGLFRRPAYWLSMLIVLGFQVLVDGWLTKLSAPIVEYSSRQVSGLRGPWDIPVEDFAFGFALVTAALLLWERQGSGPHGKALSWTIIKVIGIDQTKIGRELALPPRWVILSEPLFLPARLPA